MTASTRPDAARRLRAERQLERARHPLDVDVGVVDAVAGEPAPRAVEQPVGDVVVEAAADDRRRAARSPSSAPSYAAVLRPSASPCQLVVVQTVEEVAHALAAWCAGSAMFSGFGAVIERHPLDDLEAEALEAAVLGRVVGHAAAWW